MKIRTTRSRSGNFEQYPINHKCLLRIEIKKGVSLWSIIDKVTGAPLLRFSEIVPHILARRGGGWFAYFSEEQEKSIEHSRRFSSALEAMVLYFHEAGHQRHGILWPKKLTPKEELKDEREAWAFSLLMVREISRRIGITLVTKKNRKNLMKQIHDCIRTYEPKKNKYKPK